MRDGTRRRRAASGSPRSHASRSAAATRSSRSCARRAPSRASGTRRASPPSRTRARRWSWRSRGALVSTAFASPRESFPDFPAPFNPLKRSNADHAPAPLTRGRNNQPNQAPRTTGAQGGSHARPAARAALRAAPARIRGELAHPCVRVRRRGLPPIRRPDAGAPRRPVERAARHLRARPGRRRRAGQRRAAAHPQCRRSGGARRAGAQRPPRAARRQGAGDRARVHRPPASHPPAGSQIHVPGWSSSMYTLDAGQHLVYDAEIVDGLVHAWKARQALGLPRRDRANDRRPHPPRRAHALLALADDPAQPGQLVRADLRGRRDRVRRATCCGATCAQQPRRASSPARATSAPACASSTCRTSALRARNVDSAEYANIVLSFLRFYNQGRQRGWRRCRAPAAGSSAAGSAARWRATGRTRAT